MQDNLFQDNAITGGDESTTLASADGTEFVDNTFTDAMMIRFEDCTGTVMTGNSGLDDVNLKVTDGSCFDSSADAVYTLLAKMAAMTSGGCIP